MELEEKVRLGDVSSMKQISHLGNDIIETDGTIGR